MGLSKLGIGICILFLLTFTSLSATEWGVVNVKFPNISYVNSSHLVNISLEKFSTNSTNQSWVLLARNFTQPISGNATGFSFLLPTSTKGSFEFSVALIAGNLTRFNESYGYKVTDDWDNDGFAAEALGGDDCNDKNPSVKPHATEVLRNGIDDDCNSSTLDVQTTAIPVKSKFMLGEGVKIEVDAQAGAAAPIAIYNTLTNALAYSQSITGQFPINVTVTSIKKRGNYSVNIDRGGFLEEKSRFEVYNSVDGDIDVEPSDPRLNEETTFEAVSVEGGFSPYKYSWNFGDTKTSTGKLVAHTYTKTGEYTVTLKIDDSEGNSKSFKEVISVLTTYKATIAVRDSNTKGAVKGAEVVIEDVSVTTDSSGKAVFKLPAARYSVGAYDANFEAKTEEIKLTKDQEFEVLVKRIYRDSTSPEVAITSPANNAKSSRNELVVVFSARDSSRLSCDVLTSQDKAWWVKKKSLPLVQNLSDEKVVLSGLLEGAGYWKIACADEYGNIAESEVRSFSIDTSVDASSEAEYSGIESEAKNRTNDLKIELDNLLSAATGFSSKQKEISDAIGWKDSINKKKKELDMISSDVYNLRFRKINETERLVLAKNLTLGFERIMGSVISDFSLSESQSFVYYPSKEALANISQAFIKANGYAPEKYDSSAFEKANQGLQSEISVTTNLYHVELTYYDGNKEKITLVKKSIEGFKPAANISLVEYIPKSIAATAAELTFFTEAEVLLDDPLFRLNPENSTVLYWIQGYKEFAELQNTHLVVLSNDIKLEARRGITGFSIFGLFHLDDTSSLAFVGALIVVVVLSYYLLHSLGAFARLLGGKREYQNTNRIDSLMLEANDYIDSNDLEKASMLYKEIELFFAELSERRKEALMGDIQRLANRINLERISSLFNNAVYLVENCQKSKGREVFNQILSYYNLLSEETKAEVSERLKTLREMLEKNG
jgi:PKD repeat protein